MTWCMMCPRKSGPASFQPLRAASLVSVQTPLRVAIHRRARRDGALRVETEVRVGKLLLPEECSRRRTARRVQNYAATARAARRRVVTSYLNLSPSLAM